MKKKNKKFNNNMDIFYFTYNLQMPFFIKTKNFN